jgi:hypothetical protein
MKWMKHTPSELDHKKVNINLAALSQVPAPVVLSLGLCLKEAGSSSILSSDDLCAKTHFIYYNILKGRVEFL